MATLVDYQTLSPARIVLDASGSTRERTLTWTMPTNFVRGTGVAKPIIAFMVAPADGTHLKIFINHREIVAPRFSGFRYTGFFHVFSAATAFPEGSSFATQTPVRLLVLDGSLVIENVVMWYQVHT